MSSFDGPARACFRVACRSRRFVCVLGSSQAFQQWCLVMETPFPLSDPLPSYLRIPLRKPLRMLWREHPIYLSIGYRNPDSMDRERASQVSLIAAPEAVACPLSRYISIHDIIARPGSRPNPALLARRPSNVLSAASTFATRALKLLNLSTEAECVSPCQLTKRRFLPDETMVLGCEP